MTRRPDEPAPETVNSEQEDEEAQAQTVAAEALQPSATASRPAAGAKRRGGLDPDDAPDLVDHLKQMETSGIIDMSAYRGEETMDDLENRYGRNSAADPDFADDDS